MNFVSDDHSSGRPKAGLIYELYAKRCFKASGMDFDDLLYNMYILLSRFPDALHKYQHKFTHILVDEFQDTNYAQYTILKKLAAVHENMCVVGDDAQSIYAFRGANIQNILSFQRDYPDLAIFKLEQNYRSTKNIVSAANSLIEKNKNQLKKEVWTENDHGDKIQLMRALSDNEEGMMVANSIFETRVNHQWNNKSFAILYRTNAQSRSMEEALRKMNIPYRIYGGLSFYKRKEIKDLIAYFRLVINPNDEEALKRIINVPARGIGKTTIEKMTVVSSESDKSLWQLIENPTLNPCGFNSGTLGRINDFVTMIRSFAVKLKIDNAFDLGSHIATSSGLLRELYQDKTPEGMSRYENLQELMNGIREFVDGGRSITPKDVSEDPADGQSIRTLDQFMQDIALLTDADENDSENDDKVSLMTIHAAKGLEFQAVYVVGLEENLFPSQMSMDSREDLEEERRLFYVALTRAEKKLTLSYANSRYKWGNLISCEPSRFLEEVDPACIDDSGMQKHKSNFFFDEHPKERWEKNVTSTSLNTLNKKLAAPPNFKRMNSSEVKNFEGDDTSGIQIGMEVEHEKFGVGKVLNVDGKEGDLKATVFFEGFGNKQLLLKFAKLRIVGS